MSPSITTEATGLGSAAVGVGVGTSGASVVVGDGPVVGLAGDVGMGMVGVDLPVVGVEAAISIAVVAAPVGCAAAPPHATRKISRRSVRARTPCRVDMAAAFRYVSRTRVSD
jgi:hypothetical protein